MMSNKSNIAVFSLAYSPFEGGAEIAIREIISRLAMFDFAVLTAKFSRKSLSVERNENVEIYRLGRGTERRYGLLFKKILYIFQAWQEAERLHRDRRFDLIWVVMASYGGVAALLFKMNHPNIPLLLTIQEGDSEKHLKFGKLGLVGLFGKMMIKNAEHIQVISSYLKNFILQQGAQVPIDIVPNGVDERLFNVKYRASEIKILRDFLGIKDEYVVITTSRLVYKNGVDILINAIAEFKKKRPNIKCLIIGDGPNRRALEKSIVKSQLSNVVMFLGQIPQRDLPLYFSISDMFVRPSRSEGLGSSFLEAMCAGVPVIGTPVGGIVDFLKNGETGLLADPESSAGIALKMHEILDKPDQTEKMIRNAKELIKRNYSWEIVAKMMRNIFDKLINL